MATSINVLIIRTVVILNRLESDEATIEKIEEKISHENLWDKKNGLGLSYLPAAL